MLPWGIYLPEFLLKKLTIGILFGGPWDPAREAMKEKEIEVVDTAYTMG
jgi:hypothetical protein